VQLANRTTAVRAGYDAPVRSTAAALRSAERRRGRPLLGALLVAAVLSGCTLNNPYNSDKVPASQAVADLSPDTAAAVKAVGRIREQAAFLDAVTAKYPGLAQALSSLTALHQAQAAKLLAAVPDNVSTSGPASTTSVPGTRRRAVVAVENGENVLRLYLIGFAETARSGPFARLLGSMSAGIPAYVVGLRALIGVKSAFVPFSFVPDSYEQHTTASKAAIDALQAALAAEHAAVYLSGVYGAQASKSRQPALFRALLDSYHAHRRSRDELTVMIADLGAEPVAAHVAYALPVAMSTTAELNDAALTVERRIVKTFGQLIENTASAERRWALVALDNAAVRQLEFRGTPEMFPGSMS
jgi:hypothetical protein